MRKPKPVRIHATDHGEHVHECACGCTVVFVPVLIPAPAYPLAWNSIYPPPKSVPGTGQPPNPWQYPTTGVQFVPDSITHHR